MPKYTPSEKYKRLELAIYAAKLGVWDWKIDTDEVYFSEIWKEQIGYLDEELNNDFSTWIDHLHPDDSEVVVTKVQEYLKKPDGGYVNEFRFRHKNGSYIWILAQAEVIIDENGKAVRMYGSHTDITERKLAELEVQTLNSNLEDTVKIRTEKLEEALYVKELLLKEINHRVKNNLQIISSLINLQKNISGDVKSTEMLTQTANRIQAMALIHKALYQSAEYENVDFVNYVNSLISYLSNVYDTSNISINTEISDSFTPNLAVATSCGMIIMELITNCIKHAFRDQDNAQINIQVQSSDNKHFELKVSDNGIGISKDTDLQNTESLGMQIVCSLTEQLEGEIEFSFDSGAEVVIKV